jgi:hypothetical protein
VGVRGGFFGCPYVELPPPEPHCNFVYPGSDIRK